MLQPRSNLGWTGLVRTLERDLSVSPNKWCGANRALFRRFRQWSFFGSLLQHRTNNLWDDVSRALNDDGIPFPQILSQYFVEVVQGCSANRNSADINWLQVRNRSHVAGSADLAENPVELGESLLRWEFIGDRPSRTAGCEAEGFLVRDAINLDHNAIYPEWQLSASGLNFVDKFDELIDAGCLRLHWVHRKSGALQARVELALGAPPAANL